MTRGDMTFQLVTDADVAAAEPASLGCGDAVVRCGLWAGPVAVFAAPWWEPEGAWADVQRGELAIRASGVYLSWPLVSAYMAAWGFVGPDGGGV